MCEVLHIPLRRSGVFWSFENGTRDAMLCQPPATERSGKLRDLAVVVGLIALGIVASAGSIWIIWQVGGIVP